MQKLVITTIVGGLFAASSAVAGDFATPIQTVTPEPAPAVAAKGDVTVGYNSQHMFRGVNLGNDQVTAEIGLGLVDPFIGLELDFTAWYGSSSSTSGFNSADEDELRLALSTSKDLGFAKATVGYVFYHFMNDGGDNQEAFIGLSKELYGYSASLTYFHDIQGDNQGYTELGLGKTFTFLNHAINFNTALGYLAETGGLSHVTTQFSYDYAFGNAIISPYVAYTVELDDLEQAGRVRGGSQENELFAGAALKVQF